MDNIRYYKSGEFAKKAKVSIRTIRYYDNQGILKPSALNEAGYRLYTDSDYLKLQRILTMKSLGFTLEEIRELSIHEEDHDYLIKSLDQQLKLVRKKVERLQCVEQALLETSIMFHDTKEIDWNRIINLIHVVNLERSLIHQYNNSVNIDIRIKLHQDFSTNKKGWFPWIYSNLDIKENNRVLEIGCGNGQLWKDNMECIPHHCSVTLSDISEGMVSDAKENLKNLCTENFTYRTFDCHEIATKDESYDIVVANHLLFYLKDINKVLMEIKRILKVGGTFYCSTYGREHMKEVELLVQEFDSRIVLSEINLYEVFGLENGSEILSQFFPIVERLDYEDYLIINQAQPLLDYIMSCHGNQKEYINDRYDEFRSFITDKIVKEGSFKVTKRAGSFRCIND